MSSLESQPSEECQLLQGDCSKASEEMVLRVLTFKSGSVRGAKLGPCLTQPSLRNRVGHEIRTKHSLGSTVTSHNFNLVGVLLCFQLKEI